VEASGAAARAALRAVGMDPSEVERLDAGRARAALEVYRSLTGVDPCDPELELVALAAHGARPLVGWSVLGPVVRIRVTAGADLVAEHAVDPTERDALWRVWLGDCDVALSTPARRAAVAALAAGNGVQVTAGGTVLVTTTDGTTLLRVEPADEPTAREIRLRNAFRIPVEVPLDAAVDRAFDARRAGRAAHFDGVDLWIENESGAVEVEALGRLGVDGGAVR
jgi:hypothetical protein